jgi:hypothetical protein
MNNYPSHYAYPSSPPVYRVLPGPPRLHWARVLILSVLTKGLFGAVWMLVQANWSRSVHGKSRAFVFSIVYLALMPALIFFGFFAGLIVAYLHVNAEVVQQAAAGAMLAILIVMLAAYYLAVFSLKGELQDEPIGIPLGAVMTFFFGSTYFQYHLRDYTFDQAGVTGFGLGLSDTPAAGLVPIEQDKSL